MLQNIRDKASGWVAALFLGAVGIVFIFWGVDPGVSTVNDAARVNGERIPAETIRQAWQQRQAQLAQMMGGTLPAELARSQQEALLDDHIRVRVMTQRAAELGYRVSDARVAQTIRGAEALQVGGTFSRDAYTAFLRNQGRSEAQFETELRNNLALEELQTAFTSSAFVTPKELERRRALEGEQREVEYLVIPAQAFATAITVTDDEIQAWYDERKDQYMTADTVDLEYLELQLADVERQVEVTDEALRAFYEEIKERYTTTERRHARHVLISLEEGADAAADAAALKRAEDVAGRARGGEDFGKLAQEFSEDPGSAQQGGDLGWATRGMFVGPFEEAIFAMNLGEIRGPVKTQFGYHVIRLDEVDAGAGRSFEDVRAELEPEFRRDRAQALFYERGQKLADDAFAASSELGSVATGLGLPLKRINGFTRVGASRDNQGEARELASHPDVVEAAFSTEVAERGQNSPLITLGDDRAMVLRVSRHEAPQQQPLEVVRAQIEATLRSNAAQDAAARRGNELLAQLEAGAAWNTAISGAAKELALTPVARKYVGRQEAEVPQPVLQTAFSVPRAGLAANPAYRASTLDNGDFVLVAVSGVRSGTEQAEEAAARAERGVRTAQQVGGEEFSAYIAEAERSADIEKNPAVFN